MVAPTVIPHSPESGTRWDRAPFFCAQSGAEDVAVGLRFRLRRRQRRPVMPPDFDLRGVSTWRLLRQDLPAGLPVAEGLRAYFRPLPLGPMPAVIDCRQDGNLEFYTLLGIESPLGSGAWTVRPWAGLVFEAPAVTGDVSVTFFAEPLLVPGRVPAQPMELSVNGRRVADGELKARGAVTLRVPAAIWNARRPVMMALHFPAAVSPRALGQSLDERMLAWRLERVVFQAAR